MIKYILCLIMLTVSCNTYASDWVPYYPHPQTNLNINQNQIVNYARPEQTHTPSSYPVIVNQLIPVYNYSYIISERRGIFCNHLQYTYIPNIQYVYQPVLVWPIYR